MLNKSPLPIKMKTIDKIANIKFINVIIFGLVFKIIKKGVIRYEILQKNTWDNDSFFKL